MKDFAIPTVFILAVVIAVGIGYTSRPFITMEDDTMKTEYHVKAESVDGTTTLEFTLVAENLKEAFEQAQLEVKNVFGYKASDPVYNIKYHIKEIRHDK